VDFTTELSERPSIKLHQNTIVQCKGTNIFASSHWAIERVRTGRGESFAYKLTSTTRRYLGDYSINAIHRRACCLSKDARWRHLLSLTRRQPIVAINAKGCSRYILIDLFHQSRRLPSFQNITSSTHCKDGQSEHRRRAHHQHHLADYD
jgi:hypothetical protein